MANPVTGPALARFVSIASRATYGGKETKYEITLLFDKTDAASLKPLSDAAVAAANAKYGTTNGIGFPFVDGDTKEYKGYAGKIAVKFSSQYRPQVVDQDLNPILDLENDLYDGCIVRVSYNVWNSDKPNKHVAFGVLAVQKLSDGERLGGGCNVSEDFGGGMVAPVQQAPVQQAPVQQAPVQQAPMPANNPYAGIVNTGIPF